MSRSGPRPWWCPYIELPSVCGPSSPPPGTERIKRRGCGHLTVRRGGDFLLLKWKLHFLPNLLHWSVLRSSLFLVLPGMGVGPAGLGPVGAVGMDPPANSQGSCRLSPNSGRLRVSGASCPMGHGPPICQEPLGGSILSPPVSLVQRVTGKVSPFQKGKATEL